MAAGTVLWRVGSPRKYFVTVFDRSGAVSRLGDVLFAELGAAIGRNPLAAFVSFDPAIPARARGLLDGGAGTKVSYWPLLIDRTDNRAAGQVVLHFMR